MSIQNFKHSAAITLDIELEYFSIAGDVCVYRLKTGITTPPGDVPPGLAISAMVVAKDEQGFATLDTLEAFTQGLSDKLVPAKGLFLLHDDVIADARKSGFQQAIEMGNKAHGSFMGQMVNPFDILCQSPELVANVTNVGYADHMLFKLDGTPLPIAMCLGYCDGCLDNSKYDLEKALAILAADDRVVIISEPAIMAIPHYNCEEGRTQEISIVFSPTQADAIALWEQQKSYGSTYPSTRKYEALADLDLLGLRAGGAELLTQA